MGGLKAASRKTPVVFRLGQRAIHLQAFGPKFFNSQVSYPVSWLVGKELVVICWYILGLCGFKLEQVLFLVVQEPASPRSMSS